MCRLAASRLTARSARANILVVSGRLELCKSTSDCAWSTRCGFRSSALQLPETDEEVFNNLESRPLIVRLTRIEFRSVEYLWYFRHFLTDSTELESQNPCVIQIQDILWPNTTNDSPTHPQTVEGLLIQESWRWIPFDIQTKRWSLFLNRKNNVKIWKMAYYVYASSSACRSGGMKNG